MMLGAYFFFFGFVSFSNLNFWHPSQKIQLHSPILASNFQQFTSISAVSLSSRNLVFAGADKALVPPARNADLADIEISRWFISLCMEL
jgi:hypothetical protein